LLPDINEHGWQNLYISDRSLLEEETTMNDGHPAVEISLDDECLPPTTKNSATPEAHHSTLLPSLDKLQITIPYQSSESLSCFAPQSTTSSTCCQSSSESVSVHIFDEAVDLPDEDASVVHQADCANEKNTAHCNTYGVRRGPSRASRTSSSSFQGNTNMVKRVLSRKWRNTKSWARRSSENLQAKLSMKIFSPHPPSHHHKRFQRNI
jgi:hypothetical protein